MTDVPKPTTGTTALTVPGPTAVAEPIVLRNELWSPADPNAYEGGKPAETTHLAELDRKSTRLNSSHSRASRMPSSA